MDTETARELIALNNRFYTEHAASFSATRSTPWTGWKRLVEELRERDWGASEDCETRTVLDLACGNLRFERFLTDAFPAVNLHFTAIDSCPALIGNDLAHSVSFRDLDILDTLLDSAHPVALSARPCDLAVSFGFMHHVPSEHLRLQVLESLVDATAHGGFIALSFWRFMDDRRLAAKSELAGTSPSIFPASLDANDHFLGWQDDARPLRYCHHFTETEIDGLVSGISPRAHELARWSADGSSGTLNRYLLLQRS